MKEKELECLTLIRLHPEIFTFDKQNDIYHSSLCQMSIGNTKNLRKYVEKYCKSEDRETYGKLFDVFNKDALLTLNYNDNADRFLIMPIASAFQGKGIDENWLLQQEEILHEQKRQEDKFISSSIEAQYDNYQSSNETIEENEAKSAIENSHDDLEME